METALVGASVGALLAFGLLRNSRRRVAEEAARQREAELFARRLRGTAGIPGLQSEPYAAAERA